MLIFIRMLYFALFFKKEVKDMENIQKKRNDFEYKIVPLREWLK